MDEHDEMGRDELVARLKDWRQVANERSQRIADLEDLWQAARRTVAAHATALSRWILVADAMEAARDRALDQRGRLQDVHNELRHVVDGLRPWKDWALLASVLPPGLGPAITEALTAIDHTPEPPANDPSTTVAGVVAYLREALEQLAVAADVPTTWGDSTAHRAGEPKSDGELVDEIVERIQALRIVADAARRLADGANELGDTTATCRGDDLLALLAALRLAERWGPEADG